MMNTDGTRLAQAASNALRLTTQCRRKSVIYDVMKPSLDGLSDNGYITERTAEVCPCVGRLVIVHSLARSLLEMKHGLAV